MGTSYFDDIGAIEIRPNSTTEDFETAIRAVYRQVLGNAYVMDSERLTVAESQFKRGEFSVREFVRAVGKSDLYRSRFFDSCPRYRAFEMNFKHFLGRSPDGFEEMKLHSAILDNGTFEDEIDSYLDSDEYLEAYGEDMVPFYRGYKTQTGKKMLGFTHMFQMLRGSSSSDFKGSVAGRQPALNELVIQETSVAIVPPSRSSTGWSFQDPNRGARTVHGVAASTRGKVYRIEITGYRANKLQRVSKFRRSNQVLLVPFERLSEEYKRIAKLGGIISSITAV
ncbi:MAG: phycobilisome linker polypeptide [Cyanobacteria bacterium P01_D01_bin.123]